MHTEKTEESGTPAPGFGCTQWSATRAAQSRRNRSLQFRLPLSYAPELSGDKPRQAIVDWKCVRCRRDSTWIP